MGQARATDMLGRIMRAQLGSTWKDIMVEWKKAGPDVFLQNIAKQLSGFGEAAKDLEGLWDTVKSSLETVNRIIMRGGLKDMHDTIVQMGKDLLSMLRDSEGNLTNYAKNIQNTMANVWLEIKNSGKELWAAFQPLLGILKSVIGLFWEFKDIIKIGAFAAFNMWLVTHILQWTRLNIVISIIRGTYAMVAAEQAVFMAGATASALSLQGITFSANVAYGAILRLGAGLKAVLLGNWVTIALGLIAEPLQI